jgi:hypothetical protein
MLWWWIAVYAGAAVTVALALLWAATKTVSSARHLLDSHLRIVEERYQAQQDVLLDHDARLVVIENLTTEVLSWIKKEAKMRRMHTVNLLDTHGEGQC